MADLDDVFTELRGVLTRHAESLIVTRDKPGDVQLETKKAGPSGTRMWFAAARTGDEQVSVHFMPVASHPDLLDELSDALRAQLRGRSCFDFTPASATPELVAEFSAVVDAGLARYRADGLA